MRRSPGPKHPSDITATASRSQPLAIVIYNEKTSGDCPEVTMGSKAYSSNEFTWTCGGNSRLSYKRPVGTGGFGEVYEVYSSATGVLTDCLDLQQKNSRGTSAKVTY